MKILMLDTVTFGEDISLEKFKDFGEVVTYSNSTHEEAVARVREHKPDVIITNKVVIDKDVFEAGADIKMVAEAATGYNNIDTGYAKEHGIRVSNVAGYSTQSVIQHTFALLFYVYEKMRAYDDYVNINNRDICFEDFLYGLTSNDVKVYFNIPNRSNNILKIKTKVS